MIFVSCTGYYRGLGEEDNEHQLQLCVGGFSCLTVCVCACLCVVTRKGTKVRCPRTEEGDPQGVFYKIKRRLQLINSQFKGSR